MMVGLAVHGRVLRGVLNPLDRRRESTQEIVSVSVCEEDTALIFCVDGCKEHGTAQAWRAVRGQVATKVALKILRELFALAARERLVCS